MADAHRRRISAFAQRRPARVRRRRERQGRDRASGLPPGGAIGREPVRHRGRSGAARAHDVCVAEDRPAGVAGLANPAHPRRSARPAAVLGNLGGSDLRPDGAIAGSRRRLLHRLRGDAAGVRRRGPKVRRQSGRVLRVHARQSHLRQLRHRAAADRPLEAGAQAERSDALCRRRQGARRRHRDLRRAAGRDRRRAVRLDSLELHPPAAARRRELRQLRRGPGQCAGA